MASNLRTFIGIPISEEIMVPWKSRLHRMGIDNVLSQLHITLAFIGNLDQRQIERLDGLLQQIKFPAETLTFAASGHFCVKRKPILWAGVANTASLMRLRQQVTACAKQVTEFDDQQSFVPHISLTRNVSFTETELAEVHQQLRSLLAHIQVTQFGLYHSCLTDQGAKYECMAIYNSL
ncbi:RNA 2',3'-cyclic phosphodiesterase [Shewanella sp. 202IG2-18]|uniref:RNA 2',3'-cyclic phosphodiesterase n=1 Tax=Parashewanella hymeniacidonis TaxID=2807618 RepID=UPI00195F68B0|nr:RNA 2',3'-cyclic phosphodiesterase [Parashewanella hymeniacidonis]MBM7071856.1 RNA 2',3'-cyclic phosphodiesterase [Parashewanella hymeniacidonis]